LTSHFRLDVAARQQGSLLEPWSSCLLVGAGGDAEAVCGGAWPIGGTKSENWGERDAGTVVVLELCGGRREQGSKVLRTRRVTREEGRGAARGFTQRRRPILSVGSVRGRCCWFQQKRSLDRQTIGHSSARNALDPRRLLCQLK